MRWLLIAFVPLSLPLGAQQPIGRTSATEVQVSGAVEISHGETLLGNGSAITAGTQAVKIALQRGGTLRVCSTSSVHLSKDRSVDDPANSALMMALDRGAIEANYTVGKYSDVLMTPDLRILISGPGQADLSIRVNTRGDTCVDNHGAAAPYVTVSSQLEDGAYRVLPDQRVNFEHGSLREVVDHEPELCGCPATPVTSVASTGTSSASPAVAGRAVGGPSSTPADTTFPIAESEGLAPPPTQKPVPVVPSGQPHVQVSVPLTYSGETPPATTGAAEPTVAAPAVATSVAVPASPAPSAAPAPQVASAAATAPATPAHDPAIAPTPVTEKAQPGVEPGTRAQSQNQDGNVFHRIGHFFSRIFGRS
jgi:hypothetical protein